MDTLTIAGIVIALAAVSGAQYLEGGELSVLLNSSACLIVVGGTLGAVMLQTPFHIFKQALRIFHWLLKPPKWNETDMIEQLIDWAKQVRKGGLFQLEQFVTEENEPFVNKSLEMLLVGKDQHAVKQIMEIDIDTEYEQGIQAIQVYESMGIYSPTIGIIGAVLGLIQVMRHLTDPSELGVGIAVAFVATIYGVGLANLFFLPVANKLRIQLDRKIRYRQMILDGIMSIAEGEHPEVMRARLTGFLGESSKPAVAPYSQTIHSKL